MLLSDAIKKMQEEMIPNIPPEAMEVIMRASQQLIESGIDQKALKVGADMPAFTLSDATGNNVSSTDLLSKGPLVISFYRGAWCPYCNAEMRALESAVPSMKELGATLVAISPNKPDTSLTLAEKHELSFTVLSDLGNSLADQFGLVFAIGEELKAIYSQFGFDLPAQNGDDSFKLPIPATYVVDQNGKIVHAFVTADYTQREEPTVIIEALKQLKQKASATA